MRPPSLQERHDAFYAQSSADCRSTDKLQFRVAELETMKPYNAEHHAERLEIERVLARRKSQVELEKKR